MNHYVTPEPGRRCSPNHFSSHLLSLYGLLALLLAVILIPASVHAQDARVARNAGVILQAAQADGLPADLRDEPVRRRLRAALDRAAGQRPTAEAPASKTLRATLRRILAASSATETKLTADDGVAGDQLGWAVAVEGDRALAGAPFNAAGQSAAYVFAYDGTDWAQDAKLTATNGEAFDTFGWSVAIDGDRAFVGAPFGGSFFQGAAYVFEYDGTAWTQQAKLTALDGASFDSFGQSVSIDGDRALVGAFGDDSGAGAAYVFEYDGTAWTQQAKLTPTDAEAFDFFGQSVSLDGDRALVGATLDDDNGSGSGSAYVFAFNGAAWSQQAKLLASDGEAFDDFGTSVALHGDRALVGAVAEDENGASAGSAYVFAFDGAVWTEEAKLLAADGAADDFYGISVALAEGRAVVGSPGTAGTAGAAYAYVSGTTPSPPHPFLFLADEKIVIEGQRASVGDLYSNGEIEIKKGRPSTHIGNLTAVDDIKIDKKNTIDGDVTAGGKVERKGRVTITGTVTANADVDPLPLPELSFSAGGREIFVGKNRTLTLAPGTYGDLKVEVNATVMLSSGAYFFEQAEFKKEAVLSVDVSGGPVTINVVADVKFEKETAVEIVPLGEAGSPFVRINTLDDVTIKKDARVLGTIVAPEGNVTVDKDGYFRGLVCAKQIEVKKGGTLLFHGAAASSTLASEQAASAPVVLAEAAASHETPEGFRLAPNYPNPFNPVTTIAFDLPEATPVRLVVYDVTGRAVARLVERPMAAGPHQVQFDAARLPSGVYVYRLTAGPFVETRRMVLVR